MRRSLRIQRRIWRWIFHRLSPRAVKRGLTRLISTPEIDGIYEEARAAGAIGGKLLGAGGGGFMLLFVRPEDQPAVRNRLRRLLEVPVKFERSGSEVIFYEPETAR